MRIFLNYLKNLLHVGRVHEAAEHERARAAADERYAAARAEEEAHVQSCERLMLEIAQQRAAPNGTR
jgi:uncharacterized membrane protein